MANILQRVLDHIMPPPPTPKVDRYLEQCRAYNDYRASQCTPAMIAFMNAELEIVRQGGDPERADTSSDQLPGSMTKAQCDERAFWFDERGVEN